MHLNALFGLNANFICIIMHTAQASLAMSTHLSMPDSNVSREKAEIAEGNFLSSIAKSIRAARSRKGITRKQLANDAGVSQRLLAQLESGQGNISVVLLRRITNALNISLNDLFVDQKAPQPERNVIQNILEKLPENRLKDIAERLVREFGGVVAVRMNRLALIGLRGAGKSTLGAKLAKEFKVPFIELDAEIEKDAGIPLAEIFSLYGQSGYRRFEKRTLERVLSQYNHAAISVGGGVVSEKETYDYLLKNCFTIWIKAQPEEHMARVIAQGDFRAMENNNEAMDDLRRILESREHLYEKADGIVDTSGETVEQSFAKLKNVIRSVVDKTKLQLKKKSK
jgi:XRE family aerobic/anaerobic benzoate catabolism transcriptional regulator